MSNKPCLGQKPLNVGRLGVTKRLGCKVPDSALFWFTVKTTLYCFLEHSMHSKNLHTLQDFPSIFCQNVLYPCSLFGAYAAHAPYLTDNHL